MKFRLLFALCSFGVCTAASANPVVDQQSVASFNFAWSYIYPDSSLNYGQSFVQSSGKIAGAGFQLAAGRGSGSETFTIGLYSADPSINPGSLVVSGTAVGSAGSWIDVFWTPIVVNPAATLYLSISSTQNLPEEFLFATTYTNNSAYAAGTPIYDGFTFTNIDLGFRTYTEVSVPDASATSGLMAGAILGLVALRHRSKPGRV